MIGETGETQKNMFMSRRAFLKDAIMQWIPQPLKEKYIMRFILTCMLIAAAFYAGRATSNQRLELTPEAQKQASKALQDIGDMPAVPVRITSDAGVHD